MQLQLLDASLPCCRLGLLDIVSSHRGAMRARLRFEYVSNGKHAESSQDEIAKLGDAWERAYQVWRHLLQCERIKTNFRSGRIALGRSQSSLSSYARSMATGYLILPRIPLFSSLLFYSSLPLRFLSLLLSLNSWVSKVILLSFFFFFNLLSTTRTCIVLPFTSHSRTRPLKIFLWELHSRFIRSIKE